MNETFSKVEDLASSIKDYANLRLDSLKFEAAEKSSEVFGNIMARIAVGAIAVLFLFFSGIALALLIGEWTAKMWHGFLIVAGIYLLLAIILWQFRDRFFRLPVMNSLLDQLLRKNEKD